MLPVSHLVHGGAIAGLEMLDTENLRPHYARTLWAWSDRLEAQLDAGRFVRVHRSYLLNVERLARLELYAKDSWIAILADGTRIPVSRTGHARLKELLG